MQTLRFRLKNQPSLAGKSRPFLFLLLPCFFIFTACRHSIPALSDEGLTPRMEDSLRYLAERHYTFNSNFEVISDSLMLKQLPLLDELPIYKGGRLVVAEFMIQPTDSVDSVWVKVAHDQETMGWLHEKDLLKEVVPVDPISRFIYFFGNAHVVAFLVLLALFFIGRIYLAVRKKKFRLVWLDDIDSVYATVLLWLLAVAATLYAGIRHFAPDMWDRFYYAPSLNPLQLPFLLAVFIVNVWGIVWMGLATLDEVIRRTRTDAAFFYLSGVTAYAILIYLFFTYATYYYIGYPCLLAYTVWVFIRLRRFSRYRFFCGNCGARLRMKGICPHCGALNE